MTELNEIFKQVAQTVLPAHSYLFERWSNAHEKLNNTDIPAVIHIVPHSITMELNEMQTKTRNTTTCMVAFFDLCPSLDASGEDIAKVADKCKDDARAFLRELTRKDGIEIIGSVRMEVAEASGMIALAGVVLEMNIRTSYESLCSGEA